jgi:hypothetical protein
LSAEDWYQCRSSNIQKRCRPCCTLVVGFLLNHLLCFLLLGLQKAAQPLQHLGSKHKRRRDSSLAAGDIAIAAALLVLVRVGAEDPVFGLGALSQRPVDHVADGLLDILRLGLDDGNALVNLGQKLVTELVSLGGIGLCVGSRSLEVRQRRLDKFRISSIGDLDRFCAIRVALEIGNAIANSRIGGDVLVAIVSLYRMFGLVTTLTYVESLGLRHVAVDSSVTHNVADHSSLRESAGFILEHDGE